MINPDQFGKIGGVDVGDVSVAEDQCECLIEAITVMPGYKNSRLYHFLGYNQFIREAKFWRLLLRPFLLQL